jgi:hypothetical protein
MVFALGDLSLHLGGCQLGLAVSHPAPSALCNATRFSETAPVGILPLRVLVEILHVGLSPKKHRSHVGLPLQQPFPFREGPEGP